MVKAALFALPTLFCHVFRVLSIPGEKAGRAADAHGLFRYLWASGLLCGQFCGTIKVRKGMSGNPEQGRLRDGEQETAGGD